MKKIFILFAVAFLSALLPASKAKQVMTVTVTNPLGLERAGEMIEVPMSDVVAKLKLADTAQIVVLDIDGQQVPYQVTYDEKVVFPVTVKANGTATYTIQPGTPEPFNVIACGKYYSNVWTTLHGRMTWAVTVLMVLHCRQEVNVALAMTSLRSTIPHSQFLKVCTLKNSIKEKRAKIAELRKTDPTAASELRRAISYHIDHGYGMDCYAVGPTLGCGTAALMQGDTIIYPYCYRTQEILDNGPLRFTVKLEFNPLVVRGDSNVIETRVITLDAGSYLNKAVISYTNMKEAMPVTTGIVLREPDGVVAADAANGYITYVDPTTDRKGGNGKIFIGAAFPAQVKEAKVVLLSEKEKKERGGADGHVLAISEYEPGSEYTYYWGSAWNKGAIKTVDVWNKYMAEYAQKLRAPLTVAY